MPLSITLKGIAVSPEALVPQEVPQRIALVPLDAEVANVLSLSKIGYSQVGLLVPDDIRQAVLPRDNTISPTEAVQKDPCIGIANSYLMMLEEYSSYLWTPAHIRERDGFRNAIEFVNHYLLWRYTINESTEVIEEVLRVLDNNVPINAEIVRATQGLQYCIGVHEGLSYIKKLLEEIKLEAILKRGSLYVTFSSAAYAGPSERKRLDANLAYGRKNWKAIFHDMPVFTQDKI